MPVKIKYPVLLICAAAFFIAAAYLDLALRGRSAYLEGEKHMARALQPAVTKPAADGADAAENPAKYAYIWYRTAAESFSPPETRWTRLARKKAPDALALWNAGLAGERR